MLERSLLGKLTAYNKGWRGKRAMTHGQFGRIAIISACQHKLVGNRTMVQQVARVSVFDPLRALSKGRSLTATDGV